MGEDLERCQFRSALKRAMALAQEANRFLDEKSPWKVIKEDKQAAADALYQTISVISCLRTMLYPFLPFSSQKLHEYLGFAGRVEDGGWQPEAPVPGQKLLPPQPLFTKLDESVVEAESERLGKALEH
jgi:methionyl-tRNA synthetase